ncbi:ABC transporter ATP-binding protein [Marivibrio halodurans]|uniref:ABC transporter ATP-binding protein n=1 Tax=Marivibrio halodurans TaxID=2039722 RepID=A0A8J7S819_9PROT|nr:ABC transporter ATP-binding protein [Marivibrio halodurans]MBP5858549.1 ABC transporter ATP-binding protein [Marivibrio halodurans]
MSSFLEAKNIAAGYRNRAVISGCSLVVEPQQAVALVGRNGAGKTTLVSAISGRLPLMEGTLQFEGTDIGGQPAYKRSRLGIAHVPQGREVFAKLSVHENLTIASRPDATAEEWEFIFDLFPVLKERLEQKAGTLSGGEQQMLVIARAILIRAKLMILDEPSLGLAPKVVETLFEQIKLLRERLNIGLLLVEQQTRWIWEAGIVDQIYVLGEGTIVTSGSPSTLNEKTIERSYLGTIDADG